MLARAQGLARACLGRTHHKKFISLQTGSGSAVAHGSSPASAHAAYCCGAGKSSAEQPPATTSSSSRNQQMPHSSSSSKSELHVRLAALWGMPSELLFERQNQVAKLLAPAGCGTPAHALWLLVRSPPLRHASETCIRNSLRQLQGLVSHTEIDRAAVLTAVYKYPWIVEAMSEGLPQQPQLQPHQQQQQLYATHRAKTAAAERASWWQELAAVVLELQQADWVEHMNSVGEAGAGSTNSNSSTSRGIRMSPSFANAAVRTYLAIGEVAQRVSNATATTANRLLGIVPQQSDLPATQTDSLGEQQQAAAHDECPTHQPSASSSSSSGGMSSPAPATAAQDASPYSGGIDEVLQRLQREHQQHVLLQQLLAACPHLVALPPELVLTRWAALLSVVQGCADAAWQLVLGNPYLLMDYKDLEHQHTHSHSHTGRVAAGAGATTQGLRQAYA